MGVACLGWCLRVSPLPAAWHAESVLNPAFVLSFDPSCHYLRAHVRARSHVRVCLCSLVQLDKKISSFVSGDSIHVCVWVLFPFCCC